MPDLGEYHRASTSASIQQRHREPATTRKEQYPVRARASPMTPTHNAESPAPLWGMWTKEHKGKREIIVSQSFLIPNWRKAEHATSMINSDNESMGILNGRHGCRRKKISGSWVWVYPNGDLLLNSRQFPVVAQTYFGVKQQYLKGLVEQIKPGT